MKPLILFSHKCGQLGNRLFAFAHLVGNAAANNYTIVNLSFDEYAKYFKTTNEDIFCRYPFTKSRVRSNRLRTFLFHLNRIILKLLRVTTVTKSSLHEVVIADLPEYQFHDGRFYQLDSPAFQATVRSKKMTFLFGRFFRDYANIVKHQNVIRDYFKPTLPIQRNVSAFLENVKKNADVVVGIHIRRGDYQQFANGKYFYSQPEYCKKMFELQSTEPEKKFAFIICSNEKIDSTVFEGLHYFIGPGHLVEDMYTFAGCHLILGPPSTYTRWASFYGNVPLFQLHDLSSPVHMRDFVMLSPEELFNF